MSQPPNLKLELFHEHKLIETHLEVKIWSVLLIANAKEVVVVIAPEQRWSRPMEVGGRVRNKDETKRR
uniref:Uncharacterized protein n=1 Tax=Lupinus angustifolius TaxID=3871 RepID=A0A182BF93_LUPAN|nr:hypothetical protein [Lupinus angustifolius]